MSGIKASVAGYVFAFFIILMGTDTAFAIVLQHNLSIQIVPTLKMMKAKDRIKLPASTDKKFTFLLHKNLQIQNVDTYTKIKLINSANGTSDFNEWGVEISRPEFTIEYGGLLDTPIVNDQSNGIISNDGAILFGSTNWYPQVPGSLQTYQLSVLAPAKWTTLTQGQKVSATHVNADGLPTSPTSASQIMTQWSQIYPQQSIYLVSGPYFEYLQNMSNGKTVRVLLRKDEKDLAQSFLNAVPAYLNHYAQEIAAYPYSEFSVVENFWETGYGMPAFTLLGPSVIRLPFILNSSLPHEVLHNWWGNSVYVDYESGNWSEGLTTYMADHWQQEVAGKDTDYRLSSLISFEDYTKSESDFPLKDFKDKQDNHTQAVGYNKSMMFFHMLKIQLGADVFKKSLQDFYASNLFKEAGFEDIRASFEKISQKNLATEFSQWTERTGAPTIELSSLKTQWNDDTQNFTTSFTLSQTQAEIYSLHVPVELFFKNGKTVHTLAPLKNSKQGYIINSAQKPVRIEVDPHYDIFRTLYAEEKPATISAVLGADEVHAYYSAEDSANAVAFTNTWKNIISGNIENHEITDSLSLSSSGQVLLLGNDSRFAQFMKSQLSGQDFEVTETEVKIQGNSYTEKNSLVVTARNKSNPTQVVIWIRWSSDMNVTEWAQRLTHYGKFSALAFDQKPNVLKITWPVVNSPLKKDIQ